MDKLVQVLEAEITILCRLIAKLEEQRDAIVRCAPLKVEATLKDLEILERETRDRSRESQDQVKRHAQAIPSQGNDGTLEGLARAVGGETEEKLLGLRARIQEAAKQARSLGRRNSILIRQSIEVNNELLLWLRGWSEIRSSTYDQGGDLVTTPGQGSVDTSA